MKIIISPAKKLDASVKVQNSKMNTSYFEISDIASFNKRFNGSK